MKLFYPTQKKENYKIDAVFIDPDYYKLLGYWHTGLDINGKGGGNTDFNDAIYSIYDGIVIDVKVGRWAWGNIVRVYHPALNVISRYAHLNKTSVKEGDVITRGKQVGTMGRGKNNTYTSHLHFDIMKTKEKIPFDHWVFTKGADGIAEIKKYYIDPIVLFKKFGVE